MKSFLKMLDRLAMASTAANRVEAVRAHLAEARAEDAAWAVYLLAGRKPAAVIKPARLQEWAREVAGIAEWMFDECEGSVGDWAETVALLVEGDAEAVAARADEGLAHWIQERVAPLAGCPDAEQRRRVTDWWRQAGLAEAALLNRLLSGEFKVSLAPTLLVRALAGHLGRPEAVVSHRLWEPWEPTAGLLDWLRADDGAAGDAVAKPYTFCLATACSIEDGAFAAFEPAGWSAEWKWEGARAQLIRREGKCFIWLRREENATDWFPEIRDAALLEIPEGTVIDGEILAWRAGQPCPPLSLQTRLGQQSPTRKVLRECPVAFMAYDLLEHGGRDRRQLPWQARRALLEATLRRNSFVFRVSPLLEPAGRGELAAFARRARRGGVGGLVLKNINSVYGCGRGEDWLKLPADPYRMRAVLLYAHGSEAEAEYTFGLRADEGLVTVAKTNEGLAADERAALDAWVRANTRERFGPVRSVPGEQVFELAFDGIQESSRHKSGFALTRPRVTCWKRGMPPTEAHDLEFLQALHGDARRASAGVQ